MRNLGPGVAEDFFVAGDAEEMVNTKAVRLPTPQYNNFAYNPNTLKDAVGYKQSAPKQIYHPDLKPAVSLSVPTKSAEERSTEAVSLNDDINEATKNLSGANLLSKLIVYVKSMYDSGGTPDQLDAKALQGLIDACIRLKLSSDPVRAGLPPRMTNMKTTQDQFVKLTIWMYGAPFPSDPRLKPGHIYIGVPKQGIRSTITIGKLATAPVWIMDLRARRCAISVDDPDLDEISGKVPIKEIGDEPAGGPNLADGRDGNQAVAPPLVVSPAEQKLEEEKAERARVDAERRAKDLKTASEQSGRNLRRLVYTELKDVKDLYVNLGHPETAASALDFVGNSMNDKGKRRFPNSYKWLVQRKDMEPTVVAANLLELIDSKGQTGGGWARGGSWGKYGDSMWARSTF